MKVKWHLFKKLIDVLHKFCLILVISAFVSNNLSCQPVKIGLLITGNKSAAARQGAELAMRKANETGGLNGNKFQLVVRSMEGPWGTGSKQAVNLIFEENVWAMLGSHDGRNAHLVEQVSAKANVVFLSAWADDPTLSQAFIPWYFSCVPNAIRQSAAIFDEIYNKRMLSLVAIVYNDDYDSNLALNSFLNKAREGGKTSPTLFRIKNGSQDLNDISVKLIKLNADCIILLSKPAFSAKIFRQIREKNKNTPVFGSLYVLNEDELSIQDIQYYNDLLLIPSGKWTVPKTLSFSSEYRQAFGETPGVVAAYAYDGMNMITEAIIKAGINDREKIQKALSEINYEGITGNIKFDSKGNRSDALSIMRIKNGVPALTGE